MVDFDVEYVGDGPEGLKDRFDQLSMAARGSTNEALLQTAREVKDDLEKTSPRDTEEYANSWYIFEAAEDEVWILNSADHAKFVMLPNSKMQGSAHADVPSQGILHNVKGVAERHQKELNMNFSEALAAMFAKFKPGK